MSLFRLEDPDWANKAQAILDETRAEDNMTSEEVNIFFENPVTPAPDANLEEIAKFLKDLQDITSITSITSSTITLDPSSYDTIIDEAVPELDIVISDSILILRTDDGKQVDFKPCPSRTDDNQSARADLARVLIELFKVPMNRELLADHRINITVNDA